MIELLTCIFISFGVLFILAGTIGLLRLPDFFTRTHGPTKSVTLGLSCIVFASLLQLHGIGQSGWLKEFLIIFFLFLTAPAAAHILSAAARKQNARVYDKTQPDV